MVLPGPSCLCINYAAPQETDLIDEATDLPVCDYDDNPTELYRCLEQHQWGAVSRFLKTGVWPGNFFSDPMTPKQQVRTWIHRYSDSRHELRDDHDVMSLLSSPNRDNPNSEAAPQPKPIVHNGRVLRWRQLPLHAALIFMAPPSIVKQLIELFPYALRCPDDKGMLPLHLAFRQGVPDDILTILLRLFPNGMHVRDLRGRLPVECVRVDLMNQEGVPPLRGMIIQSIMQQSKDKFSKQQHDTIQTFQKDIEQLHSKMKSLEQHLERMDQREQSTRQELSSTLEQLNALKKNHRKLQEMQRYSIQRQSEQETVDKQHHDFQKQLLEKLDLVQAPSARSRSRGRSHSRGRSLSRGRSHSRGERSSGEELMSPLQMESPRERAPPAYHMRSNDSLGGRYSNARRQPSPQTSFSQVDDDNDDSPSYSSGVSRFTEFTKGVPNAYTTTTAYTARSNRRGPPSVTRSPSHLTRNTQATATTFHTQAQMAATDADEESNSDGNTMPFRGYPSRRRPMKQALYPLKVDSESTEKLLGTGKVAHAVGDKPTSSSGCGATESPASLNWDFSFTPGFLRPLSINEL